MNNFTVGYLVGSLAKASLNRLLAKALIRLAPPGLQMIEIPFKDLPLYNPDYEADYPAVAQALKDWVMLRSPVPPNRSTRALAPARA